MTVSVWDTGAELRWTIGTNKKWAIELAVGEFSDDFYTIDTITLSAGNQIGQHYVSYTTSAPLLPDFAYRLRIIPITTQGRGPQSPPVSLHTLPPPSPYWERILTRRYFEANDGGGFAYPVTERPHLDPDVEINAQGASFNPAHIADPPYAGTPSRPSGRQGHTMTAVENYVYMYGGRSNGNIININVYVIHTYIQYSTLSALRDL